MLSSKLFLCAIAIISCVNAAAQALPAYIKNLPLKPNQSVEEWPPSMERYDILIYLDDGILNEHTIDSLATDSKMLMDSVINTLDSSCDYLGFRYVNRTALNESSIWIQYWLRNREIVKIDYSSADSLKGDIHFPLLTNQHLIGEHIESPETYINDLIVCNIITKSKNLGDSLNRDSKEILLKLIKTPPPTGLNYTAIRVRYVNQFGGEIIKEYKYDLTAPYSPNYYVRMYENEK